jgi:hypothetical protein
MLAISMIFARSSSVISPSTAMVRVKRSIFASGEASEFLACDVDAYAPRRMFFRPGSRRRVIEGSEFVHGRAEVVHS